MTEKERILGDIRENIVNLDSIGVQEAVKCALSSGISPREIMTTGVSKGLETIGKKFEEGEYFLPELIISGETVKEALQLLEPHIEKEGTTSTIKVVIGTVEGDVHDIGKDIVVLFLGSRGFEVVDLGVDVSPEIFVEAVRQHNPLVLGMSALLTHTAPMIGEVIVRLRKAGLREKVKVLIGGAPITSTFAQSVGADYAAKDALDGVSKCLEWLGRGE
jgi:5-methyltetrahydrofolate--homocysteine methyltransferase